MSTKSDETSLRELNKTVLALVNKVTSLEKIIFDQNTLIKKLISGEQVSTKQNYNDAEGKPSLEAGARPVREARARAASAIAGCARKPNRRPTATEPTTTSSVTASVPPTTSAPSTSELVTIDTAQAPIQAPHTSDASSDECIQVRRRRVQRSLENVTRGTAAPSATSLFAAERKSYLHLYFLKMGTTADEVVKYLRTIAPDDNCTAETLKSRGDYASFKLSVPTKNLSKYLSPENWAEDVHIKPWRSNFRRQAEKTVQP